MKKVRGLIAIVMSFFLALNVLSVGVVADVNKGFKDVHQSDWFYDSVTFVKNNGVMEGVAEDEFAPDGIATRAMIITMIYRLEGEPELAKEDRNIFSDVEEGAWYGNAISWGNKNKIIEGYPDGTFKPNANIYRQDVAKILHNYAVFKNLDLNSDADMSKFIDFEKVSDYAKDAIRWANKKALINGVSDTELSPKSYANRAQIATIFARFLKMNNLVEIGDDGVAQSGEGLFTVTFYANPNENIVYKEVSVKGGEKIDLPEEPNKYAHRFYSWYLDKELKEKFNSEEAITKDISLYAKFFPIGYDTPTNSTVEEESNKVFTVKFFANDGSEGVFSKQEVKSGKRANSAEPPVREGYQFAGWFLDKNEKEYKNYFDFAKNIIDRDIDLYAVWVDMKSDSDGDGLSDDLEEYVGSDENNVDTDGDGLNDYQEVVLIGTNPLEEDSDGDGVSDFDEDYDGDILSNGYEFELGTDPADTDTDIDGLDDNVELEETKTNPLNADTDGDGGKDGWEVLHGYDPNVFDASFDIVVEAMEPSEGNPVTAGVSAVTKSGDPAEVGVKRLNFSDDQRLAPTIAGYLGNAYEFTSSEEIDSATLTFEYDSSLGEIGENFQPRIYYFNEEEQILEELEDQIVTEGKVLASVSHFSKYILLNKVEFDKVWKSDIKKPSEGVDGKKGIDIVFVIDSSGSMYDNDYKELRKVAAKSFVDKLGENDRGAVVDFDQYSSVFAGFTSDHETLNSAIDNIDSNGGTNLSAGMSEAISLFSSDEYAREDAYKYIVFLTDGVGDYSHVHTQEAVDNDIVVYTVGLGSGISEFILREIASRTGGKYYFATDAEALPDIYSEVSFETIDYTLDSNNDGISDYYTELIKKGELAISTSDTALTGIDLNYNIKGEPSDDFDGDGLKNGEEIHLVERGNFVYFTMTSNPLLAHSDGDGMSDYTEVIKGTDPLVYEADGILVDAVLDDNNFEYATWLRDKGEHWFYEADRAFLAAVFGVWNKSKLYREPMIDFFADYAKTSVNDSAVAKKSKGYMLDTISDIMGNIKKHGFDNYDMITSILDLRSKINGTNDPDKITYLIYHSYSEVVNEVFVKHPDFSVYLRTSVIKNNTYIANLTEINKKIGTANKIVGRAVNVLDLAKIINDYSKVSANVEAININSDILESIIDYSDDKYAVKAARQILAKASGEVSVVFNSLLAEGVNIGISELVSIAAKKNVYVAIIVVVRDGLDIITGVTEDIKNSYQVASYKELNNSIKYLLKNEIVRSSSYYKVYKRNLDDYIRLGSNLIQARLLAQKKFADLQQMNGVIGYFIDRSDWYDYVKKQAITLKDVAKALHFIVD